MNKKELVVVFVLGIGAAFIWGFNFGKLDPATTPQGTVLSNQYREITCKNIVKENERLICKVELQAEDDNIRIFKGPGAIDE